MRENIVIAVGNLRVREDSVSIRQYSWGKSDPAVVPAFSTAVGVLFD